MRKLRLIIIILFWSSIVYGQSYIDLAKFDYAITPASEFENSSNTTVLHEINGNVTLPLVINDDFAFLTGVTYENISAKFDINRPTETFFGIALKLGASIKHNAKWSGTYLLLPQLSSDLEKVSNRDLQLGGVVLMNYTKSENFKYRIGVYANSERFGPFIVPILGFYYLSATEKFEANVLLPLSLDVNYSLAQNLRLGLAFKGQVKSYNVNTPVGLESNRYLTKSAKDAYTYLQYGLKNGINFQVAFGRSIGRSYLMYSEKVSFGLPLVYFDDNRTELNSEFSDSWLFKVGILYRLKLGDDSDKE